MSSFAFRNKNYNINSDRPVTAKECTAKDVHSNLIFIALTQTVDAK